MVASAMGVRVAVIALAGGKDPRRVSRYERIAVVRLSGSKRRASMFRYVIEYFTFLARAYCLMRTDARFQRARVVHVHSLPDFLVAAARPARRRGARVILDLHEIFPEFAKAKFSGLARKVIPRLTLAAERWSRRQADVVLTVNRAVADLLGSRAPLGERLVTIHNLPDTSELGSAALTDGNAEAPTRLVYHGTLTGLYGLDLAVDAVAEARRVGLDLAFDIFGGGPDASALTRQIARLQLSPHVGLRGVLPHAALRSTLTTYHAALIPTRLNVMTAYSLSTKLLEYVHLGVPILAPRIPTYLTYFPADCLWYYEPNDTGDAVRAIKEFVAASRAERIRRARAAQEAIQSISWAGESRRLAEVYRDLLGDTTGDLIKASAL